MRAGSQPAAELTMLLTIILMGLAMPRHGQSLDLCKMGLCNPDRMNRIYNAKANRSERVTTAATAQTVTSTIMGTTTTTTEHSTEVTTVATTTVYASPASAVPVTEVSTDEGRHHVGGPHVRDPHNEEGEDGITDPLGQEDVEVRQWEKAKLQFEQTKKEGDGGPNKAADLPPPSQGQVDGREEEQVIKEERVTKEEHEGKLTTDKQRINVTNGTRAQKYKKVSTGDKTILRGLGAGYIILILTLAVTMLITGWFSAWGRRIRTAWKVRARRSRRRYNALKSESMTNVFDPAEDEEEADGTEQQEESGANIVRPGAVEAAEVLVAVQVHGEAQPANDIEMRGINSLENEEATGQEEESSSV